MTSVGSSPRRGSVTISDAYREWSPTQSWLAETIRTVATILYAKAADEDSENKPCAIHRNSISGQVERSFGAVLDETAPQFSISWVIDLLIQLGDLAMVGHGYCIPRESRIVRLTRSWGRIAGGLPLSFSEHREEGVKSARGATIGRVTEFADDFDVYDRGTEHSEVLTWLSKSTEQIFSLLNQNLPDRRSSQPTDGTVVFYNAGFRRARTRGDRWQSKVSEGPFAVARTRGLPAHYFVCVRKELLGWHWFEVTKGEGRKWVLLAERHAGTTNLIRATHNGNEVRLRLPDMLPDAWTRSLLACSATVVPTEGGWELGISRDALPLFHLLVHSANIELV